MDGVHPAATWSIEDGVLIGRQVAGDPNHGHLFSDRDFEDFTVRIEFMSPAGNSGLYFVPNEAETWHPRLSAEIDGHPDGPAASTRRVDGSGSSRRRMPTSSRMPIARMELHDRHGRRSPNRGACQWDENVRHHRPRWATHLPLALQLLGPRT